MAEAILRCKESGTTVSAKCHAETSSSLYSDPKELEEVQVERLEPRDFEAQLKATLPMCLHLRGLDAASDARPDGALLVSRAEARAAKAQAAIEAKAGMMSRCLPAHNWPSGKAVKDRNKSRFKTKNLSFCREDFSDVKASL